MSEPRIPAQRSTGDLARIFNYRDGLVLRTVAINGEPWFVAKDICDVLGIGRQQDATRYLDDDEVQSIDTRTVFTGHSETLTSTNPMVTIVSEAGLYSLILRSRKDEAKPFKRWVTHEVLPSIRKHGGYLSPNATEDQLASIINRAEGQARVLRALNGVVDAAWLDAKGRHVAARALGEEPEVDPATRPLTVGEYLEGRGVRGAALRSLSTKFGRQIKTIYRERFNADPPVVDRFVDGALRPVAGYTEAHRTLFDEVYAMLTAGSTR